MAAAVVLVRGFWAVFSFISLEELFAEATHLLKESPGQDKR